MKQRTHVGDMDDTMRKGNLRTPDACRHFAEGQARTPDAVSIRKARICARLSPFASGWLLARSLTMASLAGSWRLAAMLGHARGDVFSALVFFLGAVLVCVVPQRDGWRVGLSSAGAALFVLSELMSGVPSAAVCALTVAEILLPELSRISQQAKNAEIIRCIRISQSQPVQPRHCIKRSLTYLPTALGILAALTAGTLAAVAPTLELGDRAAAVCQNLAAALMAGQAFSRLISGFDERVTLALRENGGEYRPTRPTIPGDSESVAWLAAGAAMALAVN